MIDLYFYPSPNGLKITLMMEECGLQYTLKPVNILRGEQFAADFLAISPNNKIPAIVDRDAAQSQSVFESGAILVYLAEKTGLFLPQDLPGRAAVLQWLFWQVGGLGPMAGQAHHFRSFASEVVPYGIKRYTDECNRLYGVLDRQLQRNEYVAGGYSIADMAIWPWIAPHKRQGQTLENFPNLQRWFAMMRIRPAARRAYAVGHEQPADAEAYQYLYGQTAATSERFQRE